MSEWIPRAYCRGCGAYITAVLSGPVRYGLTDVWKFRCQHCGNVTSAYRDAPRSKQLPLSGPEKKGDVA